MSLLPVESNHNLKSSLADIYFMAQNPDAEATRLDLIDTYTTTDDLGAELNPDRLGISKLGVADGGGAVMAFSLDNKRAKQAEAKAIYGLVIERQGEPNIKSDHGVYYEVLATTVIDALDDDTPTVPFSEYKPASQRLTDDLVSRVLHFTRADMNTLIDMHGEWAAFTGHDDDMSIEEIFADIAGTVAEKKITIPNIAYMGELLVSGAGYPKTED